ncbi:MAG: hypothetical protein CME62_05870 [Halobacteriovoraceae bacterium]|nr:hypothetical protein [Halobacteriovoraceae bacterium]|tara:strand:- start:9112 stop:9822 length:711 start_codon:yes stop_codon:yes gene_type:complete
MSFFKEITLFTLSLTAVYFYQWDLTDLLWSFWTSSFIVGYLTILHYAFFLPIQAIKFYNKDTPEINEFKKKMKIDGFLGLIGAIVLSSLPGLLFIIPFFTIHFGGFHSVHAMFLQQFAPIEGIIITPPSFVSWFPFFQKFPDVLRLFVMYWPVVLATAIYEFSKKSKPSLATKKQTGKAFMRPYANVIKIHILIFALGFAKFQGLTGFPVYAIAFTFFFFPFSKVFTSEKSSQTSR